MSIILAALIAVATAAGNSWGVWPPSTAFSEIESPMTYGIILVAFIMGVLLGIKLIRNRHEHK